MSGITVTGHETYGERAERYPEIIKLYNYCIKIGVEAVLMELYDGFIIRFNDGSDFVQHHGSYGCNCGCVEPQIGCKEDYTAVDLKRAKSMVFWLKRKLNRSIENDR